ncbi:hypothetical protein EDB89DRAFT_1992625 [Lactarius sanguifluus]|nr:hypothetical protein EDB89DRAFT_1992625 [Lactarius sanguifluus]
MLSILKAPRTIGIPVHHWYPTPFSLLLRRHGNIGQNAHYKVVRTGRTGRSCPGSSLGAVGTTQGHCWPGQLSYGKGVVDTAKGGWSLSTVANLPKRGPGNTTKHRGTHIRLVLPAIYSYIQKNDTNWQHRDYFNGLSLPTTGTSMTSFITLRSSSHGAVLCENTVVIIRVASCRTCRRTH